MDGLTIYLIFMLVVVLYEVGLTYTDPGPAPLPPAVRRGGTAATGFPTTTTTGCACAGMLETTGRAVADVFGRDGGGSCSSSDAFLDSRYAAASGRASTMPYDRFAAATSFPDHR